MSFPFERGLSIRDANTRLSAQMIIPANKTAKPLELSSASDSVLETWLFKHEKRTEKASRAGPDLGYLNLLI